MMIGMATNCPNDSRCPDEIMEIVLRQTPPDSHHDLMLLFLEAITNAREHGNNSNPNLQIYFHVRFSKRVLEMVIEDQGEGFEFDSELAEQKRDSENPVLNGHGHGLLMMAALADKITVSKGGRRVKILKRFHSSVVKFERAGVAGVVAA